MSDKPPVMLGEGGPSEKGWHRIESFLRCAKEYQFQHVRKISEPLASNPDYFSVGLLVHAGRAQWFALRFEHSASAWSKIVDAVKKAAEENKLPITLNAEQQALSILAQYVEHYRTRVQPDPLAAEYLVGPAPLELDGLYERTARLDDVSKYPEAGYRLAIGECKTTGDDINKCVEQYTLHGQPMLQYLLWKMSDQGEKMHGPVAGVVLDVIKKPYGKEPAKFARQFIPISDYAVQWYVKSMTGYLSAASRIEWDSDVPRNVSSCTRLVGRIRVACPYRDLCQYGKSAATRFVTEDGKPLVTWKPSDGKSVPPWL